MNQAICIFIRSSVKIKSPTDKIGGIIFCLWREFICLCHFVRNRKTSICGLKEILWLLLKRIDKVEADCFNSKFSSISSIAFLPFYVVSTCFLNKPSRCIPQHAFIIFSRIFHDSSWIIYGNSLNEETIAIKQRQTYSQVTSQTFCSAICKHKYFHN